MQMQRGTWCVRAACHVAKVMKGSSGWEDLHSNSLELILLYAARDSLLQLTPSTSLVCSISPITACA